MDTKALRQKVLDLAIRGKLVPQDPNDEPASVLLERIRAEKQRLVKEGKLKAKDIKNDTIIFVGDDNLHYEKFADGSVKCIEEEIPFELPEKWGWSRVASFSSIITDGEHKTPRRVEQFQGYYLLSARNIQNGHLSLNDVDYVDEAEYEMISKRCNPMKSDVLISCSGSVGRVTVVCDDNHYVMVRSAAMIRPITIDPYYIMYALQSSQVQNQIQAASKQTAQANLFLGAIQTLLIPIPPQQEARRIVTLAANAISITNDIAVQRASVIQIIASTKKKILDLAIRGLLVPQNPADEPASVLLERIRAEREGLIRQGKIRRDKKESIIFRGDDNSYYRRSPDGEEDITDDLPYAIPDSWEWTTIGELFAINPRNKIADDMVVSFIPMPLIDDGYSGCHRSETRQWKDIKTGFTHFENGDIGLAKITPCFENRKSVIFRNLCNGYGAGTTELHVLRPHSEAILPEYALALLKSERFIKAGIQAFTGAVGQQRIGKDYVMNTYFPLPPYTEQCRIVDKIKKLFYIISTIETAL